MSPYIYLRALKHAEHTVFCVAEGQKTYWDEQFRRMLPYASGQQLKRSILEAFTTALNTNISPVTFYFDVVNGSPKEAEVLSLCDPTYPDQLIGGWMSAESRKGEEKEKSRALKRRSPLSISAMRPLHPLLSRTVNENISFDRSDKTSTREVRVRDAKGNVLSEAEVAEMLSGTARSLSRKWIQDNKRATGLFVHEVAIDLRRLFAVSIDPLDGEVSPAIIEKLKKEGWKESETVFGKCMVAPKELRDQLIPALAHALINWRITSNQARTFSLMETLAIAISDNANKVAGAIRVKLKEEEDKVEPIIDDTIKGVHTFITLPAAGYIRTKTESFDALDRAEELLIEQMRGFDYERQLGNGQVQN